MAQKRKTCDDASMFRAFIQCVQPKLKSQIDRSDVEKCENEHPKCDDGPLIVNVRRLIERNHWPKADIDNLAKESEKFEILMGLQLQEWFPDYVVEHHVDRFFRHDYKIYKPGDRAHMIYIELECGLDQHEWMESIYDNRRHWVHGLNVLSRKIIEGKKFDVLIKHDRDHNSFFAVTYDWIHALGEKVGLTDISHNSLGFKTNDKTVSIPWKDVDSGLLPPTEFCFDDPLALKRILELQLTMARNRTVLNPENPTCIQKSLIPLPPVHSASSTSTEVIK